MSEPIHFIVLRSRHGWAVNVEADRLSEYADVRQAREAALLLAEITRRHGQPASYLDLSEDGEPAEA